MIARTPRVVAVGTTPVQIRDTTKPPPAFSIYRYTSAGVLYVGKSASMAIGTDAKAISADTDFTDFDSSVTRYMVASTGTINVTIEDHES